MFLRKRGGGVYEAGQMTFESDHRSLNGVVVDVVVDVAASAPACESGVCRRRRHSRRRTLG